MPATVELSINCLSFIPITLESREPERPAPLTKSWAVATEDQEAQGLLVFEGVACVVLAVTLWVP